MIAISGKKILLLGLGLHGGGAATARWLLRHGAKLVVSDLRPRELLEPSIKTLAAHRGVTYVFGRHREQDVRWADYVVYNPGVPRESTYLRLARRLNKPVYNEASLFFDRCRGAVIAVTGTRGKSTVASLIAAMCKKKNPRTVLAGNIKTAPQSWLRANSMLSVLDRVTRNHLVVLELSSWQLEGLHAVRKAPEIAVVVNVYPDHLNRYRSLSHYYSSKKEIFRHQTPEHFLVLNKNDRVVRQWQKEARSRVVFFSRGEHNALMKGMKLEGEHNAENARAAITAAKQYGVSSRDIRSVLRNPPVLSGRQEVIALKEGVAYVNDTTSTTPEAGIAALKRFGATRKKNIILIAGGADKKLAFGAWARAVRERCKRVYLLVGDASGKQRRALRGCKNVAAGHDDLGALVRRVASLARPGDVVLFSPSAASFNLWSHEFARGDAFNKAVRSL
ncbi:MAG: UDP-N-acetylmuramoyl-L-alanine--D-glutamate ligase [Parcubacteria group bacterium]|nr:UDP-N-acetylmuramoyl-L-alanine--D-glutamate ligase [Parcubacteria group bacterium]